jgi:tetratricopeptide (TPR) repeat protein
MSEDYDVNWIYGKEEALKERADVLLKLAPNCAETHAALAIVRFLLDWKWREAETEFKTALAVDANCRMALTYYGYYLTRLRRAKEARPVLERALSIDSGSPLITKFLGHCEYVQRHYEQSLPYYLRSWELEPAYPGGHYWAGRVYLAQTNYFQALREFQEHELRQGLDPAAIRKHYGELQKTLKEGGPPAVWLKCLEQDKGTHPEVPYWYAECYARLGQKSKALDRLQQAVARRDTVEDLLVDEFWDNFREDITFKELLQRVGLDAGGSE